MNLRKFISGVSALAIAASAFAGMAVTASAEKTALLSADFNEGSSDTVVFNGGEKYTTDHLSDYGKVYRVNNGTATAVFDTDSETEGNQPIAIGNNEAVTVEFDALHGWLTKGNAVTVTLYNSDDEALASYDYTLSSTNLTDAKVLNTTVSGFTAFGFGSRCNTNASKSGANGFGGSSQYFVSTDGYNPHISITIDDSGLVGFSFVKSYDNINKEFSGKIGSGHTINIAKMTIANPNNNDDRAYAIDNLVISKDEAAATGAYTINYVCGNDTIKTINGNAVVGSTPTFDTASVYGTNGAKYIYVSNNADEVGGVVAEGVTYTLTYRAAEAYTVSTVANNGTVLMNDSTVYEGDSYTYHYSKYLTDANNKVTYTCDASEYQVTTTPTENTQYKVDYTAYTGDDVIYFYEQDGSYTTRAVNESNGSARTGDLTISVPEDGTYIVTANAYGNAGGRSASVYYTRNGGDPVTIVESTGLSIYAGGTNLTANGVNLRAGDVITVDLSENGCAVDYVILTRTGDIPTPNIQIGTVLNETVYGTDANGNKVDTDASKAIIADISNSGTANGSIASFYVTAGEKYTANITENGVTIAPNAHIYVGVIVRGYAGTATVSLD